MKHLFVSCLILAAGLNIRAAAQETQAAKAASGAETNAPAGNVRIWQSKTGAKIEAEFVEEKYGFVALRGADGNLVKIAKRMLSREDQDWIAAQGGGEGDRGTGAVKPPAKLNHLPTYADGPWKGQHAVYEDPNFDAVMNVEGVIRVYPKIDGARSGKALRYSLSCFFTDTSKTPPRWAGRPVIEYQDPPAPQMQPERIELKGLLRDNVPFEVTFEFKGNKLSSYGWLKDPDGLRDPTIFRTGVWVPQSHTIPLQMKMSEQRELLKDYEVRVKPVNGKLRIYPYSKSLQPGEFHVRSKEVQIIGPVFGDRKVRVIGQSTEKAPILPWIYPGYAPWQGYFIGLHKDEPESRATSQRMVLIID
jgi:hypothetical protein